MGFAFDVTLFVHIAAGACQICRRHVAHDRAEGAVTGAVNYASEVPGASDPRFWDISVVTSVENGVCASPASARSWWSGSHRTRMHPSVTDLYHNSRPKQQLAAG